MSCIKCGGTMIGDGYTSVIRCEYADGEAGGEYAAPDEGPFYCDFKEEDVLIFDASYDELSDEAKRIVRAQAKRLKEIRND